MKKTLLQDELKRTLQDVPVELQKILLLFIDEQKRMYSDIYIFLWYNIQNSMRKE